MNIKKIIVILLCCVFQIMGMENTSIIQITLSDLNAGYLQGVFSAKVSIIDNASNQTYWSENQSIYFNDGFTELKLGPVDNFHHIERPRVVLEIDGSTLTFPIYPTLFSLHSQTAEQLSDSNALYIHEGNVGVGTTTPSEKLSINGNIQFLNNFSIKFSNGELLNGDQLLSINNQLQSFSDFPNRMSGLNDQMSGLNDQMSGLNDEISSILTSINILETASGANSIQANSSFNNAILKIDSNGSISPYNDFYISDSNHYLLRSQNQGLHPTKIGSDFIVDQNELSLNALTSVSLANTSLTPPNHQNGVIQYSSGNYYIYRNGQWQLISSPDLDKMNVYQLKTVLLNSLTTTNYDGAIAFDGTDYYIWKNAWEKLNNLNFSGIGTSSSATNFVVLDQNGAPFKTSLNTNGGLLLDGNGLKINDQLLMDNRLVFWKDHQFQSVSISDTLSFEDGALGLAAPFSVSSNAWVGIGVDPTATLDVNGVIRLRTHSPPSLSNVSAGSLIFDGTDFKGWDGSEWKVLSSSAVVSSSDEWSYNNIHLVANPNGYVGIKVNNPQATLDVSGNIRIRDISTNQSLNSFIVTDANGDLHSRSLQISDLLTDSSDIRLNGNTLEISSMNASSNDMMAYVNNNWQPISLTTDPTLTLTNHRLALATANVTKDQFLVFNGTEWDYQLLTDQSSPIILENSVLKLATQNATIGQQLTWNGISWVPSQNETVSYSAGNGIQLNGTAFELAHNLDWSNNALTIGASSSAQLNVNRLSSSLTSPIKVVGSSNETLLDIDSSGRISIGLNGAHNGYSIASEGFNFFRHSLTHKQAAIGTTNIGTAEFGPTLLVHSVSYENPAPTRSIIEVLSIDGSPRLEIQEGGQVGISTGQPKATLDINGYARLKKYASEPIACDLDHDGSIALNSQYKLCVCNGSSWVETNDGTSACNW
tara:strand:- start:57824 stop:60622 length:2799 start_codon:yes stop_codon:yes gene_type:complete